MNKDRNKRSWISSIASLVLIILLFVARTVGWDQFLGEAPLTEQTELATEETITEETITEETISEETVSSEYVFRNASLLKSHYEKHGIDMGFSSEEDYEAAAAEVIRHPDALHKVQEEDGDDVYYLEETNEFVVLSSDGYIRTYFYPDGGISYYERQ